MTRTPERDAEIVRMWADNMKATEIAAVLGVTKNTIIGAVDRAKKRGELPLYRDNTNVPERRRLAHAAKVEAMRAEKAAKELQCHVAGRAIRSAIMSAEKKAKHRSEPPTPPP